MGFLKKVGKVLGKVIKYGAPILAGATTPGGLIKSFLEKRVGQALGKLDPVAKPKTTADGPFVKGTNEAGADAAKGTSAGPNPSARSFSRSTRKGGLAAARNRRKVVGADVQPPDGV